MRSFSKNKYLDSLYKTILFFAFFHLILLLIFSIKTKNIEVLNIFNIIGLGLFFNNLNNGGFKLILSFVLIIVIYILIFIFSSKNNKNKK
jgi:predicted membrane protein